MQFTPGAIRFSECETSGSNAHNQIAGSNKQQHVSPLEANEHPSNSSSPGLPESGGREDSEHQKETVSDQLDSTTGMHIMPLNYKCINIGQQQHYQKYSVHAQQGGGGGGGSLLGLRLITHWHAQ